MAEIIESAKVINFNDYYTNFVNHVLKPRGIKIENLKTGFADGITFLAFMEELSGQKCAAKMVAPKNDIFKQINLKQVLDWMRGTLNIKLRVSIENKNLMQGSDNDEKMVSSMLYELFCNYYLNDIEFEGKKAKDALLNWVNSKIEQKVTNFKSDFVDGVSLCQLATALGESASGDFMSGVDALGRLCAVDGILDATFAAAVNDQIFMLFLALVYQKVNKA